jgi:NAD/NADP transhydrogenase beta subunit
MGRFLGSIITTPFWIALFFLFTSIGAVSFDKMIIGFGKFVGILFRSVDEVQQQDKPTPPRPEEGQ